MSYSLPMSSCINSIVYKREGHALGTSNNLPLLALTKDSSLLITETLQ